MPPFYISVRKIGLEPIAEELSGGQFLPPAQTLVATSIFCHRQKMQIESCHPHHKKKALQCSAFFLWLRGEIEGWPPLFI